MFRKRKLFFSEQLNIYLCRKNTKHDEYDEHEKILSGQKKILLWGAWGSARTAGSPVERGTGRSGRGAGFHSEFHLEN